MHNTNMQNFQPVEPIFLEFSIDEVINNSSWMPLFEPWTTQYIDAIQDGRYGDAVWARYHIGGDVRNGMIEDLCNNITVMQSIEEDAVECYDSDPEFYDEVKSFYAQTSSQDGHKDVIEVIMKLGSQGTST